MGTDNRAEFILSFEGDAGGISTIINAFKKQLKGDVAEIEQTTANITLFRNLKGDLDKAAEAVAATSAQLTKLKSLAENADVPIGKELIKGLKDAEKAANNATREFDKQSAAVASMAKTLTAAGVNTKALATEEIRLATALKQAQVTEQERQAASVLGIKLTRDQTVEITKATAAFNLLRSSGTLSTTDIAAAQKALAARTKELSTNLNETKLSSDNLGASIKTAFIGAALPIVGVTAVMGTLVAAFKASLEAAKEWRNEVAKVATVATGTDAEITTLTDGVRRLSREMGFDAVEGVKALYNILRSGVSKENALEVLAVSADAAKASLTDIGTATKLATTLTKSYGVATSDLTRVFDIFFASQKNGGPTIAELAASLGEIAPIARASNTPINELAAVLQTMVQGGVDASQAINILGKILTNLGKPEVIKSLNDVGITVNGLVGTLQQIKDKGLNLDEVLGLGVGNEKSIKGLLALTNAGSNLAKNLDDAARAAGSLKAATDKLDKTPQERMEKFSAAVKDAERNLGAQVAQASTAIPILTDLANAYNNASERATKLREEFGLTNTTVPTTYAELVRTLEAAAVAMGFARTGQAALNAEFERAKDAAGTVSKALGDTLTGMLAAVQAQAAAATKAIADASGQLKLFAEDLAKQRDASQKATAQAITDINTRATAELAAIDKTLLSETQVADAVLAIRKKQAADRLALILQNAADVKKALDAEAAALLAIAGADAEKRKKVEQDLAQARIAALAPIKAALEAHYNELLGIARGAADKVAAIDKERVAVNQSIEDQIRAINRQGLSEYDAYQDKVRQIDQLTSKARQELNKGDQANLDTVTTLANQARALVGEIGKEVKSGSETVVTATNAQAEAVGKLKTIGGLLNDVLDAREDAETRAGAAATAAANTAKLALDDYRAAYDSLVAEVKKGVDLKINTDVDKINASVVELQAELDKQKVLVAVELDLKKAELALNTLNANIKKGITDGSTELLETISASIQKAADQAPQLKLKADEAIEQIDNLQIKILDLGALKPQIEATITSNVDEVQAAIDNLKKPTESTHTVHIKTVNEAGQPVDINQAGGGPPSQGFARGGPVRARRFARGGTVFRRPSWLKVPGSGSGDTVPAALQAGSFVVRKAASRYYGDGLMGALARGAGVRRFAAGGTVSREDVQKWAEKTFGFNPFAAGAPIIDQVKGYRTGDSFQDNKPPISFDVRPIPEALITAMNVIQYAREMLNAVGRENPLLGVLLPKIEGGITEVSNDPTNVGAIRKLLQAAETIGSNPYLFDMWGKTAGSTGKFTPTWFIDWLIKRGAVSPDGTVKSIAIDVSEVADNLFEAGFAARFLTGQGGTKKVNAHFAGGGATTDTVPALLTPEEWVIRPPAVRKAESAAPGFMRALNEMRIPRHILANMMRPPMPISRFAEGGAVGSSVGFSEGALSATAERGINISFPIDGNDLISDALIDKKIMPKIERVLIKAGVLPR